jgi:hypothetical protein
MFLPTEEYKKEILTGGTNIQMPRLTQEINCMIDM